MKKNDLSHIQCFLLDMDGTINLGDKLIDGAKEFFETLHQQNKEFIFITNNSSRNIAYYLNKLKKLGVTVAEDQVLTSTEVLIYYLKNLHEDVTIYPVGTKYFEQELVKVGFTVVYDYNEKIDYVVVGFDTSLNYEKIATACRYIDKGVPYLATNPDFRCPIDGGEFIPDCGAIIEFIQASTGKKPVEIVGKPKDTMVNFLIEKKNFQKDKLAVVGDRLYTDIALGINSGITAILVLSGEASEEDVKNSPVKPDVIFSSIKDLWASIK